MMSPRRSTGQIIKEARIKKNLTQIELSKASGVYSNTIGKIERDEQKPTFTTLKKLSKALDVDINSFPE